MNESKAGRLAAIFGGNNALAAAIGVDKSVTSRWDEPSTPPEGSGKKRGSDGNVPSHYNHRIIEAAERLGHPVAEVLACLDQHSCPCCGQDLEPGVRLDPRRMISVLKGMGMIQ